MNTVGYVVFCRSDVDAESVSLRNFKHYHQKVYLEQHVDVIREVAFGWIPETDVDDNLESLGSFDGATDQLGAVTSKDLMDQSHKKRNTMVKHNKSRSMREQPNDKSDAHKLLKFHDKISSSDHQPSQFFANAVTEIFSRLQDEGRLVLGRKRNPCESFIATFPEIARKVLSPEKIQQGFIRMGAIDNDSKCRPDMDVLLNTMAGDDREKQSRLQHIKNIIVDNFAEFMDDFRDHGGIRESTLDKYFPEDTGMDGDVIPCRENALDRLSEARYTVLTNENIVNEMERKREEALQKKRAQSDRDRVAAEKYLERAQEFEEDIAKLNKPRELIVAEDLKKNGVTIVRRLLAFVISRTCDNPADAAKVSKSQNKTDLIDDALKHISSPVVLTVPSSDEAEEGAIEPSLEPTTYNASQHEVKPSALLKNLDWTGKARDIFEDTVAQCLSDDMISQEDCSRADSLAKLLLSRLRRLKDEKILNADKHKHYALSWYALNIPVMAALMVLFKHTVGDVSVVKLDECLLSGPGDFANVDDCEDHMGAYLVYDIVRRVFVRSGKAHSAKRSREPRTLGVRRKEHADKALKEPEENNFNSCYPDKNCTRDLGDARRGYFQDLVFKAALGWRHRIGSDGSKRLNHFRRKRRPVCVGPGYAEQTWQVK